MLNFAGDLFRAKSKKSQLLFFFLLDSLVDHEILGVRNFEGFGACEKQ